MVMKMTVQVTPVLRARGRADLWRRRHPIPLQRAPSHTSRASSKVLTPPLRQCFNIEDPHDPSIGLEYGELAIPGHVLRRDVFDPVINQVLDLIELQLTKTPNKSVNALILVGGFAASEYLFTRVRQVFSSRIAVIARPQDCDVATLRAVPLSLCVTLASR